MHYCTSGIFFYETWPIIPNLIRKAFMQMCTIVIVWKHFFVEEGILNSDWYFGSIYSSHGTIICVCILFRYMNCYWNRSCYYRLYIYICVFHSILYAFHYWLFIACSPFRRIYVLMIWTVNVVICMHRFIVTIHVKQSLNDWTSFIYFTESSICLINR